MPERLLSAEEVAEMLQVPRATLYQWKHRGVGPRSLRVGRHLRYRTTDLEAWLKQQESDPSRPAA